MPPPLDPIPMLPPMPHRRRRRSQRPLMFVIIGLAVSGVTITGLLVQRRFRQLADESFQSAEDLFETGAFAKAQRNYDLFRQEYPRDPRVGQAALAGKLSELAESLADDRRDTQEMIETLDRFWNERRLDPDVAERWPRILMLAERRTRNLLERADRTLTATDLTAAEAWLGWLHGQVESRGVPLQLPPLDDLQRLAQQVRERIAQEERRQGFVAAAERAIEGGAAREFAEAFAAFERWRSGAVPPDPAIDTLHNRLRLALRARVRFTAAQPGTAPAGPSVPLLPLDAYTPLLFRRQTRPGSQAAHTTVFARAKDLCFALEIDSGTPRWVSRVGYDALFPQPVHSTGRSLALVPWFLDTEPMLALCDADTGETIWSQPLPDNLAGSPAIVGEHLFAATAKGVLLQLDLASGTIRSVAELPEPIDGPLTLREDGQGLCLVGARQAVYLFDVSREEPRCSDIVLTGRRSDTAHCQALWAPPYVVIFENDLAQRCFVRVLFQDGDEHRTVRQTELDGRIWQAPVLEGADLFLVTDRLRSYCFGLDPGNSAVNLYAAAQASQPRPLKQPLLPFYARADETPFVAQSDAIHGYRLDRARGLLVESWSRAPPHPEACGAQPLQGADGWIVVAWYEPGRDGVLVQGLASANGTPVWEIRLAAAPRDVAVVEPSRGDALVAAHTDSPGLCLLMRETPGGPWRPRTLDLPTPTGPMRLSDQATQLVYPSHNGSRLHQISCVDGTDAEPLVLGPAARSPVTVYDGTLQIRGSEAIERQSGRWAVYLSSERTLEIRRLGQRQDEIHASRLPAAKDSTEPWTWAPLMLQGGQVLAAHPSGVVCRAEVRRAEGIAHLFLAQTRNDLPRLAVAPHDLGNRLLLAGVDGQCVLLDSASLRSTALWEAPFQVRDLVTDRHDNAFVLLEDSRVYALRRQGDELMLRWHVELPGAGWRLAGLHRDRLIATDSTGLIQVLDSTTGRAQWRHQAVAPLALPPKPIGHDLILATVDGGLFFVAGPD